MVGYAQYRYKLYRIDKRAFLAKDEALLEKTPHYAKLNDKQKKRLKKLIKRFMFTKSFKGARGLRVTRNMRVLIAYHASLLVLNLPKYSNYDTLKQVVVYEHTVITQEVASHGGIYTQERFMLQGLSSGDTVVISWHEAKKDAFSLHHDNLLFHEFAHEVDFMQGQTNGIPPLQEAQYKAFVTVLAKTYKRLCKKVRTNRYFKKYKLLGRYAATNEAEFFAVATERFFAKPDALKRNFPDVYKQLQKFYGIDTASSEI